MKKKFLNNLNQEITNFKQMISEFNTQGKFDIKLKKDGHYLTGVVKYQADIEKILKKS